MKKSFRILLKLCIAAISIFLLLAGIGAILSFIETDNEIVRNEELNRNVVSDNEEPRKTVESHMSYTDYEIIKSEDGSHKALGDKLLSEYSSQELNSLPLNKRISYSIVVSSKIKEAQVHPTIEKIITDLTTKDRDIDEIILFVYSDKELVGNPYDVATAVWGKDGSLGKVSAEIAKSNDRTGYQITIQVKENLEEYLLQIGMSEEKFKLSEEERRQFYKELIATERQATIDADSKYPIDKAGVTKEEITKNTDFNYELTQKYTAELLLKYGITEDQSMEISMEAWDEGWSME